MPGWIESEPPRQVQGAFKAEAMTTRERRADYRPELREQAVRLYRELHSVRRVAAAMGVSTRRAWEYLIDAGELPRKR